METKTIEIPPYWKDVPNKNIQNQLKMRETPLSKWLEDVFLKDRLSGTLRKNARIGFKYLDQLRQEALCLTLGWGFECLKSTYVTFNDAISEGDCHALTEVGWHIDRLINIHPWEEDTFILKYIVVQDKKGNIEKQGIGVVVKETSIQWIGPGNLVFAILTEYDPIKEIWSPCTNPF